MNYEVTGLGFLREMQRNTKKNQKDLKYQN
jgi:hypothetical protein